VGPIFKHKFDWTDAEADKNNTIISTCGITGLVLGSLLSGKFVVIGRRRCAIYFILIAMVSLMPVFVLKNLTVSLICVCRSIFGFSSGVLVSCSSISLSETVPKSHQETFAITVNLGIVCGILVTLLVGLPLANLTPEEAETTNLWMIPYGVPFIYGLINLLMYVTRFKEEPILFLLKKGREEEALSAIKQVY
jgi:MFS family permease